LRNALLQLNQRILSAQTSSGEPLGGLGDVILRVFAEHAPLHMAALYACGKRDHLTFCAGVGKPPALSATNILMERALRTGQVVSIQSLIAGDVEGVIAVVPLTDINGQTRAAVAIYDIPYAAFQPSTLNLLAVLGAHVGDLLMRNAHAIAPDRARKDFMSALRRSMEDYRRCALPVALIVFKLDPAMVDGPIAAMLMSSRGIDHTYTCDDAAGQAAVLRLMPLTDLTGATSYIRRLASAGKLEKESFDNAGLSYFLWSASGTVESEASPFDFLKRCGIRPLRRSGDIPDQEEKVAQS